MKETRDKLKDEMPGKCFIYFHFTQVIEGGYTPEERKEIEEKMVDGKLEKV